MSNQYSNIKEIVSPEEVNLSSFEVKDVLNPKFWVLSKDNHYKLKDSIRNRLLMVADDFFETLDINWVEMKDVILTGSLSNYNWSKYSDVDLHILIDYRDIDENMKLVKEYLNSKKNTWNDRHNIKIFGHDLELYAQDINEPHYSTGVYSLMNDVWVKEPKIGNKLVDIDLIKNKSSNIMNMVDKIENDYYNHEYEKVTKQTVRLRNKIKNMRSAGLEKNGEMSPENIVFKVLRREGYIEKLMDLQDKSYDKLISI